MVKRRSLKSNTDMSDVGSSRGIFDDHESLSVDND